MHIIYSHNFLFINYFIFSKKTIQQNTNGAKNQKHIHRQQYRNHPILPIPTYTHRPQILHSSIISKKAVGWQTRVALPQVSTSGSCTSISLISSCDIFSSIMPRNLIASRLGLKSLFFCVLFAPGTTLLSGFCHAQSSRLRFWCL